MADTDLVPSESETGSEPGESETEDKVSVPRASEIEHVHNSTGWHCSEECKIAEHTHTLEECYERSEEPVCGYHEHTETCYNEDGVLSCGKKSMTRHIHTEECYELTCENEEEGHVHTFDECYKLICGKQESEGHEHSDMCYYALKCDKREHTHGEDCEKEWVCQTDYVLLTVEYYITVNGQKVRAASTWQVLLTGGDEYKAPIEDLRPDGYKIGTVKRYTAEQEDTPEDITDTVTEEDKKYYVSGQANKDAKIIVNYVYQEEYAPYRVDYWGYNAAGQGQKLLYSYTGLGKKDSQISASQDKINTETISISVNELMKNLYDILGNRDELGEKGEAFIKKLTDAVNQKYLTGDEEKEDEAYHDITPLLEHIAGVGKEDSPETRTGKLNSLARVTIKRYIAENLVKVYGFDQESQQIWDAKLTVTADELAVRNLYYVPQKPQTVLFTTGLPNAEVAGIPQTPVTPEPDPDEAGLNYDIKLNKNYITCQPTVDISEYTKNIYGKHQSYLFVGWVTGEDAEVITDYTPANAAGKYKDLTLYTAPGDPEEASGKPSPIPAGAKTEPLADALTRMPDGGATYYAVWYPFAASYTVQIWFESEKGDNTYVESHALDIQRYQGIGMLATFNEFDVDRAKEEPVISAANASANAIFDAPVTFEDPQSDMADVYHTYADYQNSPFYGFDFLECDVCKADASQCGSSGCTCGRQRRSNADGSEGAETNVRACNYQKVPVGENGTTVLNLYYTREMWEIAVTPGVQLWTVKALQRANEERIYVYWIGGPEQTDIKNSLDSDKAACEADPSLMDGRVIRGKYGTVVDDAHKNGIGWDKVGSSWQSLIGDANQTRTLPAGTEVLLANGSDAVGGGKYVYPQDTLLYLNGQELPAPEDWILPFHCLSVIEPEMFTSHTNKKNDDNSGYVAIENGVSMWESQRFGEESIYDLSTDTRTYGTHKLKLYPYYHATSDKEEISSHTFNVNYYLEALPHEAAGAPYAYKTANNDQIKFVKELRDGGDHTVTLDTPAEVLSYGASTPDGFIPLMWRTSPKGFTPALGGFQGNGVVDAAYRYARPQVMLTGAGQYQVPSRYLSIDYKLSGKGDHNASFNGDNMLSLNGNTVYGSDWKQWYTRGRPTQNSIPVAYMEPGGHWITNWICPGKPNSNTVKMDGTLTGANGLYALMDKANQGNQEALALLKQLESSFSVGTLFPTGSSEILYYGRYTNQTFRYTSNGQYNVATQLTNTENAVAFARKRYTITYNTCFLNDDGDLLRDENGVVMKKIHTTQYAEGDDGVISGEGDVVSYDQPLGYDPDKAPELTTFDDYYNNYYDAYFALDGNKDPMESGAFTFKGYGNTSSAESGEGVLGGYGKWYLDPDGTIPFNEENLKKMPAGNIDVYYRYDDFRYHIYFVDEVNGKDKDPLDVVLNGEEKTLNAVVNRQSVIPNTTAESFPDPSDENLYFAGWFYDETGTNPYDFSMEINEDVVVYAVWKPKVPTEYKIRHVLVDEGGSEIREIVESTWETSYVGNTIDANALDSGYYADGMYFKVDDYSQSMVLEVQDKEKTKNILTFYYKYAGMRYTIEYKDVHSNIDILPSVTFPTKLSTVTVGMTEIPGWDYVGYSVDGSERVPEKTHVTVRVTDAGVTVTFWYERIPADDEIMALKLVDGVLSSGTWFRFELVDEKGAVVRTAQSVDGIIQFDSLGLDKVGTYRYTLREVNEGDKYRLDYDDTEYEVVVEITQPEITKPLVCSITYYKDGQLWGGSPSSPLPIFENHRRPAVAELRAQKYLDGSLMTGSGFSFLLQGGEGMLSCGYHVHDDSCYKMQLICGQEESEETQESESEKETQESESEKEMQESESEKETQESKSEKERQESESEKETQESESEKEAKKSESGKESQKAETSKETTQEVEASRNTTQKGKVNEETRKSESSEETKQSETIKETQKSESSEETKQSETSGETQKSETSGETKQSETSGETQKSETIRETQQNESGEETKQSETIRETQKSETSGETKQSETIRETQKGETSKETRKAENSKKTQKPKAGSEGEEAPEEGHKHTAACYEKVLICGEEESADHGEHSQSCYDAPTTLLEEVSAENGAIVFSPLSYEHTGIYVYTIHERNDGGTSWQYDDAQYRAVVEVFINDRNEKDTKVTITRDGEPVENIRFDNYTIAPAEVNLRAQKYLDGKLMKGKGFAFMLQGGKGILDCEYHIHEDTCYEKQLTCGYGEESGEGHEHTDACYEKVLICGKEENEDHKEHDQSCYKVPDTLIEEASASNGAIAFKTLLFDQLGTYVYTIHERNDGGTSYQYDDAEYRAAVEVFFNDRHELATKVTITHDGEPVENIRFDNHTVTPPTEPVTPPTETPPTETPPTETPPTETPPTETPPTEPETPPTEPESLPVAEPITPPVGGNHATGDSTDWGPYVLLLCISGAGLVYLFIRKRRQKEN